MALVRRCAAGGASAFVMRRGDAERGALFVKIATLDGRAKLFGPPLASFDAAATDGALAAHLSPDGESWLRAVHPSGCCVVSVACWRAAPVKGAPHG